MDTSYLKLALHGYGRCSQDHWQAHFPAAVIAAYYFLKNNNLGDALNDKITKQIDQLIGTKEALFQAYPPASIENSSSEIIIDALTDTIDGFNDLGHNTIHAVYILKALETLEGDCQTDLAKDMAAMIRKYNGGPPGIWLGEARNVNPNEFKIKELELLKEDSSGKEIAKLCFNEVGKYKNVYRHLGSVAHLGHTLTQGHSLIELRNLGYENLQRRGMYSFESRISLARSCQEHVESTLPLQNRSQFLPTEEGFWDNDLQRSAWEDGHVFKFAYSFYELLRLVPEENVTDKLWENFRRIVSVNIWDA